MSNNIRWHDHQIQRDQRATQKRQKPCMIWFTGLSGAGKSTVANALDELLFAHDKHTYLLDGDNVRHGLNRDLGFSDQERVENIRRIGEVGRLFVDAGLIVLSAFISPFRSDRQMVRTLFPVGEFIEVYVATDLSVCEDRDPKGLYKKARQGQIKNFTGIDSAYEAPDSAEIVINAGALSVEECAQKIYSYLKTHGYI
ncbi:adenylyl-sulfate kinase [Oleiphilus sp. HI0130]|nr:adenylyl-sulfate kinase [Oleiphilus sp. HI0130]